MDVVRISVERVTRVRCGVGVVTDIVVVAVAAVCL